VSSFHFSVWQYFCTELYRYSLFIWFIYLYGVQVEELNLDENSTPEEKIRILKELKAEWQRERGLENTMRNIGEATCEADSTLSAPVREQIEAYHRMKHKIEKLCNKVVHANQEEVSLKYRGMLLYCASLPEVARMADLKNAFLSSLLCWTWNVSTQGSLQPKEERHYYIQNPNPIPCK